MGNFCCCKKSSRNNYNVADYHAERPASEEMELQTPEQTHHHHVTFATIEPPRIAPESVIVSSALVPTEPVLVRELNQMAAPLAAKRAISVEAKSSGFIVDVPQLDGLGPDGTFLVAFNQPEIRT
ncbi:unnamed protein product [Ceutorhynchus assimilis]|uniref:Uncharacterized protein n=1 Tax=Ceutorhynchus assimilis TaxID=467358 RepID=A0A9N9MF66_9CUCU|nr:unnamed protein product [Ceutorhynchus assimilis]